MKKLKQKKGFWSIPSLWELTRSIVVSVGIILILNSFLFGVVKVVGTSMDPNLADGDFLILDKISYKYSDNIERGSIVSFVSKDEDGMAYVKRVIGLPGEKIEFRSGGAIIIYNAEHPDGFLLGEDYLPTKTKTQYLSLNIDVCKIIGVDEYFLMGDNRGDSYDSRIFGCINKSEINGVVRSRVFPVLSSKVYGAVNYNEQQRAPESTSYKGWKNTDEITSGGWLVNFSLNQKQ